MQRYTALSFRLARSRWLVLSIVLFIATFGLANSVLAVGGNIDPLSIEIDTPSANLYPGGPSANCSAFPSTITDWVKDCQPNTDPPSLVDSIATGINTTVGPNQTGAVKTGHWNGVRIVDGIAGNDRDIFLTGGKENDTSTWNVGPGTVGSSKYDITQAYLANNSSNIYFGMERRGNNGSTAFDFEFNQNGAAGGYVPTRTVGDVLFTFEMQGSGGSGSAVPHYFTWNGSAYIEQSPPPAGLVSSINQAAIPAAPWGYVNSHGDWVTGSLDRFEFAEAVAPLSLLPGVNACGGAAFVQVRTRSSSTATSDLKDTTKIFRFDFGSLSATASKTGASGTNQSVTVTGQAFLNGNDVTANSTLQWQRWNGSAWVNIAGATSATLVYSSFESDATPTAVMFSIGSDSYTGQLFSVDLRLHASQGSGCSADSAAVTVKKVKAVDP
jgi:hypothetical protein